MFDAAQDAQDARDFDGLLAAFCRIAREYGASHAASSASGQAAAHERGADDCAEDAR